MYNSSPVSSWHSCIYLQEGLVPKSLQPGPCSDFLVCVVFISLDNEESGRMGAEFHHAQE